MHRMRALNGTPLKVGDASTPDAFRPKPTFDEIRRVAWSC